MQGKTEQALEIHYALHPLVDLMFVETNPAPIKNVLFRSGQISSDHVRPPLVKVTRPGVAKIDKNNKITTIKEKPKKFLSDLAITGLYFFDNKVVNYSKALKPSKRGEVEIIDLLLRYKKNNKLSADFIGRGGAWLDTGSIEDYYKTIAFVQAIENRQGFKIACIEEIALKNKWIGRKEIAKSIKFYGNCNYSKYLNNLI